MRRLMCERSCHFLSTWNKMEITTLVSKNEKGKKTVQELYGYNIVNGEKCVYKKNSHKI